MSIQSWRGPLSPSHLRQGEIMFLERPPKKNLLTRIYAAIVRKKARTPVATARIPLILLLFRKGQSTNETQ